MPSGVHTNTHTHTHQTQETRYGSACSQCALGIKDSHINYNASEHNEGSRVSTESMTKPLKLVCTLKALINQTVS